MKDLQYLKEKVSSGTATEDEILLLAQLIDEISNRHFDSAEQEELSEDQKKEIANITKTTVYKVRIADGIYRQSLRRRRIGWLVSGLVVIGIAVFVYTKPSMQQAPGQIASTRVPTVLKGKNHFKLSDGTTVELNDDSELSFDSSAFGSNERVVMLKGQGFFDVAHDPKRPFKVKSGDLTTTVLGTAFDIRAYPGQDSITVTVLRGKVSVATNSSEKSTLSPNQQAVFHNGNRELETKDVVAEKETTWKNSILALDGVTLEEAVNLIASRSNLKSNVQKCLARNCRIEVSFVNQETPEQMMSVVSRLLSVEFKMDSNTITVTGGETCPTETPIP